MNPIYHLHSKLCHVEWPWIACEKGGIAALHYISIPSTLVIILTAHASTSCRGCNGRLPKGPRRQREEGTTTTVWYDPGCGDNIASQHAVVILKRVACTLARCRGQVNACRHRVAKGSPGFQNGNGNIMINEHGVNHQVHRNWGQATGRIRSASDQGCNHYP